MSLYAFLKQDAKKQNYSIKQIETLAHNGLNFFLIGGYIEFVKDFLDDEHFKENLAELLPIYTQKKEYESKKDFTKLSVKQIYKIAEKGMNKYMQKWDGNIIKQPSLQSLISKDETLAIILIKTAISLAYAQVMKELAQDLKEQRTNAKEYI